MRKVKYNTIDYYKLKDKIIKLREPIYYTTRKQYIKAEQILSIVPILNRKGIHMIGTNIKLENYKNLRKIELPKYYIYGRRTSNIKVKPINALDISYFKDNIKKEGFKGLLNSIIVKSFTIGGRKTYDLYSKLTGNWLHVVKAKNKEEAVKPFFNYIKNKK